MFSRVATLFTVLFFVMFAAASAAPRWNNPPPPPPTDQCSTGTIQCCDSTAKADDPQVGVIAKLLGIVLGPIEGLVGLTCNPITVIGGGGDSCSSQTVCCTGNNFGAGLLVIGCSPININA